MFKSSGTTDSYRSHHHVRSLDWYHNVSKKIYSDLIAPVMGQLGWDFSTGYLEREILRSLKWLSHSWMKVSDENFFMHEYAGLNELIERMKGR